MYEYAGITGYKPDRDGTHLKIFIPDRHLEEAIVKKRIKDCIRSMRAFRNRSTV